MKKLFALVLGAVTFYVLAVLLSSYGNVYSHREINQIVIKEFQDKFIRTAFPLEKFKNYSIVFYGSRKLKGNFISEGGLSITEEISRELNPGQWIVHGGYSADEPEIHASFRHFYDPTRASGDRYLHDHLDYMEKKGIVSNPRIDQIEWALDHPEHTYSWENGKIAMIRAFQHKDQKVKESEMAFAWRALGETLHMIADMGCPAHVRDDAHAAEPFTGWKLGSPDPYEEYMVDIARQEGLLKLHDEGKLDLDLMDQFRKAKNMEEIAIGLASYTNKNFFTTQTISGQEVKPVIRPLNPYDSPKLEHCEYDPLDYSYKKNISGNEVIMCRDLKYRLGIFEYRGYPYIDKTASYSQAKALLPQITEAGANIVRLFIPKIRVQIEELNKEEKMLRGSVVHITDEEYDREIRYNGIVKVYDAKTGREILEVDCEDGKIEDEIRLRKFVGVNLKEHGIYSEIYIGGINIRSDVYKTAELSLPSKIKIKIRISGRTEMKDLNKPENSFINDDLQGITCYDIDRIHLEGNILVGIVDTFYESGSLTTGIETTRKLKLLMELNNNDITSFQVVDSIWTYYRNHNSTTSSVVNCSSKENPFKGAEKHTFDGYNFEDVWGFSYYVSGKQAIGSYDMNGKVIDENRNFETKMLDYDLNDSHVDFTFFEWDF